MKRKRKKEQEKTVIKAFVLKRFLERIYLGGLVEECVINVDTDGVLFSQCVDMTNILFLYCQEDKISGIGEGVFGIGDLVLLCKYLENIGDAEVSLKITDDRLVFVNEKYGGQFSFLLSAEEVIPTNITDDDAIDKLTKNILFTVPLTPVFQKDYLMYLSLINVPTVFVEVSAAGLMKISGGRESDHQFELKVGKVKAEKKAKSIQVKIPTQHLTSVMKVLDFDDEDNLPTMGIADLEFGTPLVIEQDKDNVWIINPLSEDDAD